MSLSHQGCGASHSKDPNPATSKLATSCCFEHHCSQPQSADSQSQSRESQSDESQSGESQGESNHAQQQDHHGCCEHSHHDETQPKVAEDQATTAHHSNYRQSWQVEGMDCPSCARKIENAVGQLADIVDVRVLFATEKLVVQFNDAATAQAIEQTVIKTGFDIRSSGQSQSAAADKPTNTWLQPDTGRIVMLVLMMLIAAGVQWWQPETGGWLFAATCLVGLVPIATKAWRLMRSGTPFAIETLMTVAALGALYLGETAEAAMVLLLFLIGERLEGFAASRARSGVQALMALVPETAVCLRSGQRVEVAVSELRPGDRVEVAPGGRLPADGQLMNTAASIDESALTGEPMPVEHIAGDALAAGSVVVDRVIDMTITSSPGDNAIDRILHLIEEAESHKAPVARFMDSFSRWYTPLMMAVALLVVLVPPLMFAQPWDTWIYRGLAMLLIACPCALVISTPAAITSGLAAAASRGALIKGGAALERLGRVEAVAFDKTGTLTQGKPQVTDVVPVQDWSPEALLRCVAAIEIGSRHPLAISVVQEAERRHISVPHATDKQVQVGRGVSGELGGHHYQILAPAYLDQVAGADLQENIRQLEAQGKTVVVVLQDKQTIGLIAWQDALRKDACRAISELQALGIRTTMLTGDNAVSAAVIAEKLNIEFAAGLLPQDKVSHVARLANSRRVAMVGDGINDAPAMKAAHIGIAMGGGTDVALETADAALTHNRLTELAGMIKLSRAVMDNITQNVTLALGLKGLFLVTSLFGVTGLWVAVLADSGATALVTLNALRLLKFKQ
ncbi:zinc/cadmium/mercury/lead-transporting ATPase [Vibrio sp. H11]|uniref:zinc/cadmium/mercury/lead-transporting ATPase n=1 Tax=Vibrio sp. H11 TaxID=2565928 RepID=UPI0010A5FE9B|nr:zinc/cadmium/mercury/lead-transporting ATPase [Vibrio sp. H11]